MATTPLRVFAVLAIFCVTALHAIPDGFIPGWTCICRRTTAKQVPVKLIKKLEVFYPNARCRNTEIIISTKDGKAICVDPTVSWINKLLERNSSQKTTVMTTTQNMF